jgi:WD40 repeat protein
LNLAKGKGYIFLYSKILLIYQLIKNYIFFIRDPNIFVTGGLDNKNVPVKIWDIRKLNNKTPLLSLEHKSGVNVARFNPIDGTKLLTSDQDNEIRVYTLHSSSDSLVENLGQPIIIKHHHKQFQHITA